jgi:hypothetical protein
MTQDQHRLADYLTHILQAIERIISNDLPQLYEQVQAVLPKG